MRTMEDVIDATARRPRAVSVLLTPSFAVIALLLAGMESTA